MDVSMSQDYGRQGAVLSFWWWWIGGLAGFIPGRLGLRGRLPACLGIRVLRFVNGGAVPHEVLLMGLVEHITAEGAPATRLRRRCDRIHCWRRSRCRSRSCSRGGRLAGGRLHNADTRPCVGGRVLLQQCRNDAGHNLLPLGRHPAVRLGGVVERVVEFEDVRPLPHPLAKGR